MYTKETSCGFAELVTEIPVLQESLDILIPSSPSETDQIGALVAHLAFMSLHASPEGTRTKTGSFTQEMPEIALHGLIQATAARNILEQPNISRLLPEQLPLRGLYTALFLDDIGLYCTDQAAAYAMYTGQEKVGGGYLLHPAYGHALVQDFAARQSKPAAELGFVAEHIARHHTVQPNNNSYGPGWTELPHTDATLTIAVAISKPFDFVAQRLDQAALHDEPYADAVVCSTSKYIDAYPDVLRAHTHLTDAAVQAGVTPDLPLTIAIALQRQLLADTALRDLYQQLTS